MGMPAPPGDASMAVGGTRELVFGTWIAALGAYARGFLLLRNRAGMRQGHPASACLPCWAMQAWHRSYLQLRITEIVRDAIAFKHVDRMWDIASNRDVIDLSTHGDDALTAIEQVVKADLLDTRWFEEFLLGFSGVKMLYFDLCKEKSADRAAGFLQSLNGKLLKEALTAIWGIWSGRGTHEKLPSPLRDQIESIAATDSAGEEFETARRLLEVYEKVNRNRFQR